MIREFELSHYINPLSREEDIENLAAEIIADDSKNHTEKYLVGLERALLISAISFVHSEMSEEKHTLITVGYMLEEELNESVRDKIEPERKITQYGFRIEKLERKTSDSQAAAFYNLYRAGKEKAGISIAVSVIMQLRKFMEEKAKEHK